MPIAFYSEHDKNAAAWLRELIKRNLIAPGVVDERSIIDIRPADLEGFTQCHFFSGIGTWSHALRMAGWPDSRECWTGSPPCQPFSTAGKQLGGDDERHLAPHFISLIRECRPSVVFGEQVASAASGAHGWWADDLRTNLEREGYAFGMAVLGAHSVGAPHIRQRLYFVSHTQLHGQSPERESGEPKEEGRLLQSEGRCPADVIPPHAKLPGLDRAHGDAPQQGGDEQGERVFIGDRAAADGVVADHHHQGLEGRSGVPECAGELPAGQGSVGNGPLYGFWADADWLPCRDGKWRPTGPGISPLVVSDSQRARQLRAAQHEDDGADSGAGRGHDSADASEDDGQQHRLPEPRPLALADGSACGVGRGGDCGASGDGGGEEGELKGWASPKQGDAKGTYRGRYSEDGIAPGRSQMLQDQATLTAQSALSDSDLNTSEARVMRLKGYGNAICSPLAQLFIECFLEATDET